TQVIRLMFLADLEDLQKTVPQMEFEELRKQVRQMILEDRIVRQEKSKDNPSLKPLYEKIDEWVDNMAIFIFGYIVFKLGSKIRELEDDESIKPEKEIWVTSFWNLNVNKVTIPREKQSMNHEIITNPNF
ncbi:MAG: hypothetical protein ABWZ66_00905, partial [Pyrinomonadaceae bacterium]